MIPKVVAAAASSGRAAGGGDGLEAVAGAARATESGAMEPRESGKVGLEGPWGRPPPSRKSLICPLERRAGTGGAPADEPALQGRLARSPAASSSALGRVAQGRADTPLRAPRSRLAPLPLLAKPPLLSGRSVDAGGG